MALMALERLDECLDCCDRCLQYDPNNSVVLALRRKALDLKETHDKKIREKEERLRREQAEKQRLHAAYKVSSTYTWWPPI